MCLLLSAFLVSHIIIFIRHKTDSNGHTIRHDMTEEFNPLTTVATWLQL